jgi:hypothetical protein
MLLKIRAKTGRYPYKVSQTYHLALIMNNALKGGFNPINSQNNPKA